MTMSLPDPTRYGAQRAKLSQTSMPQLLSRRSTCLIACLVTQAACLRQRLANHRDGQRRAGHDAQRGRGERVDMLGVKVVVK
ncbi:MAG: hypothetical protein QOF90_167 [Acetobacteraceae bacterium]|nr:hypothetical protein [Acetobacteraceae bacterium]